MCTTESDGGERHVEESAVSTAREFVAWMTVVMLRKKADNIVRQGKSLWNCSKCSRATLLDIPANNLNNSFVCMVGVI